MKAVVFEHFGPPEVFALKEVDKPVPRKDQVLVKVHASSVNAIDTVFRGGALKIFGLVRLLLTGVTGPRVNIVGFDVSGVVEAIGDDVKFLREGDEIYGSIVGGNGAHAEYACIVEKTAALKPANITHEEAAAIPIAAITAFCALRNGGIQSGQQVLINGASGGIGTCAVQIAVALGAEVTAVCSTGNLETARSLGASTVIDYTKEDFTQHDQTYDLIFDAAGKRSFAQCKAVLEPNGIYVTTDFMSPKYTLLQILWTGIRGGKKVKTVWPDMKTEHLDTLTEWIEAGRLRPVIDKTYPLEQTAEAYRYYEQGHAKGKVVVTVQGDQ